MKNPPVPELALLKGQAYLAQKKFEDALRAFDDLTKKEPEAGIRMVVNTYFAMNRPDKALDRVRKELKENPTRIVLQAELSAIYMKMGKQAEAAENARRMIQREPGSAFGYMTLATVHEHGGEPGKAIDVLKKASHIKDVKPVTMLAALYAGRKDYQAALAQCRKAEALQPGYVPAIFQKASILHLTGRRQEAIAEYQRVLKLSPNHVLALNNLAYLHAEDRGGLSTALRYALQAYALAPGQAGVQDTLGLVLFKNGKVDEGLKALKQAISIEPDNPSICYHLALALKENKNTGDAVGYLRKAIGSGDFPELSQARTLLAELSGKAESR